MGMTKTELEKYRQQLLSLGKRLKGDLGGLQGEALRSVGGEASGNLSNAPVHMADLGSDTFEQEVTMNLLENDERTLEAIAAALQRIDAGTFGRCEECGKEIARERLQAVPYTPWCMTCAAKREGKPPPSNL